MSRPARTPRRADAERNRGRILDAAEEVFARRGAAASRLVAQAAARRTVVDLVGVSVPAAVGRLGDAVGELLRQAQQAGTVRADVGRPEVMALLVSVCQGALQGGWDEELQARTLAVVFAGLAPR